MRFVLSLLFAFLLLGGPAEAARVIAKVDLSRQQMRVSLDGKALYSFPVSTGRKGYGTPTGSWSVKRMHRMWYSRKYDNAPMPHSLFFKGGYAVHGTTDLKRLGRPASHGCVRLHPKHAAALYALAKRFGAGNTRIVVTR
jgi:lipoprotein-anchoring transpeptidase ErfK/SrfK